MKKVNEIDFENFKYDIHSYTGTVNGTSKTKETSVYSTSGNNANSGAVSSVTTSHHEFFLLGESGQERSINLVNFDFPLRDNHKLTMFWVIPKGYISGTYFISYNHNTDETHTIDARKISQYFTWFKKKNKLVYGTLILLLAVYWGIKWSGSLSFSDSLISISFHTILALPPSFFVVLLGASVDSFFAKRKAIRFINSSSIKKLIEDIK